MMNQYCQSCGMPMTDETFYGSEKDGSRSDDYCKYCYEKGAFLADQSMEEMIETCIPIMVEQGMEANIARGILEDSLPKLKRWN